MIKFIVNDAELSAISRITKINMKNYSKITEGGNEIFIPKNFANQIIDDISNELLMNGLLGDYEVNQYGRFLESLIDLVNSDALYD